MPIPKPEKDESKEQYIPRCISFLVGEGTEQKQAIAICFSEWKKHKQKE